MNVYDFDGTIYDGDCTLDFWRYCLRRYPQALLTLPKTIVAAVKFKCGLISRDIFKESFYGFLVYIPDIDRNIKSFWDNNCQKIKAWYYEQQKHDDLIISASPEFLIDEICKRLQVDYIASKVDRSTGQLIGANCRGEEKVKRFTTAYPHAIIDSFYSDSKADQPLANMAKKAFLVNGNKIYLWLKESEMCGAKKNT